MDASPASVESSASAESRLSVDHGPSVDGLPALRMRRSELRESMAALEQALAAPAPGRIAAWAERVHVALVELSADLRTHLQLTEGSDGLHSEVVTAAPRLVGAVQRLRSQHLDISASADELMDLLTPPLAPTVVEDARESGMTLLGRLVRHRQAGADLVYEAYQTDVGGQD